METTTLEKEATELEVEVKVAEVLDFMKINGSYAPILREVVARNVVLETAKDNGLKITDEELQKAADAFRIVYSLFKKEEMEKWLDANNISIETFENYIETNLLMSKFKDHLFQNANKDDYLKDPRVHEFLKELFFQDWLNKTLI